MGGPRDGLARVGRRRRTAGGHPQDAHPLDRMAAVSPAYTANRAVNAVPYVCAAAPGIHSTLDLPQVVPALG